MEGNSVVKGKVALVSFPFDNSQSVKLRPAVCLTNPIGKYHHVVVAFITSRIPDELLQTDIVLNCENADFIATGLRVSSTIRLHRLMTIPANVIRRELGILPETMIEILSKKLFVLFDLH